MSARALGPHLGHRGARQYGVGAAGDEVGWVDAFQRFTAGPHRKLADMEAGLMRRVREMALGTLDNHAPGEADHQVPATTTWERAPGVAVPVCAINGALNAPDHLAMAGRLAKLVPGGHTATVPAAAHHPSMESPARFGAEPTSFLETL
ncbi:hypothetical protein [Streptomyces sp. NPDC006510]|uniref:alpha/beta fold hydrolase n=1 Tax=Streptomyces sp. NPDC006510 TaxID=3155600 RepID=UPI0033BB8360